jgi:hypothetical protein
MSKRLLVRGIVAVALVAATITPAVADTENIVQLFAPADLKNVPAKPFTGEKITFTIPDLLPQAMKTEPIQGQVGTPFTLSGSGAPANADVTLTWSTADGSWLADLQPNTVNYRGLKYVKYPVKMVTVKADANGNYSYSTKAPEDWGGPHDIYAVVNGVALAKGGFQTNTTFTISPKSGPIGTPIKIHYSGLGMTLYTGGMAVLWDNGFAGEAQAVWTRGTSDVTILAAGPIGSHQITASDSLNAVYMNLRQSPNPYSKGGVQEFRTTKDNGLITPYIEYPQVVTPIDGQKTTMTDTNKDPNSKAVATLDVASGVVGSKAKLTVTGLSTTGEHSISMATVVGNRVNCTTGVCWVYAGAAMGSATPVDGKISTDVTIPDHLGGWHVIQIKSGDKVEAQVPFYVKQSILDLKDKNGKVITKGVALADPSPLPESRDGAGTPTYTFKAGEDVTIAVKGVGWTQFDNTLAVTYDNSYIGYGCGFNSNGYVVFHLTATGTPGTHIIRLHPLLYSNQPSYPNTPYTMLPLLSSVNDNPAIALGYQIPTYTFSIKIVK